MVLTLGQPSRPRLKPGAFRRRRHFIATPGFRSEGDAIQGNVGRLRLWMACPRASMRHALNIFSADQGLEAA